MGRNIEIRRTGKGTLLATGQVADDGTVEAIIAGQHVTGGSIEEFTAQCETLSTSSVEVTFPEDNG
jgi:hypothetical protein